MQSDAPVDEYVLIFAPKLSSDRWFCAIKRRSLGCSGFKWCVFDYPSNHKMAHMPRNFAPQQWRFVDQGEKNELTELRSLQTLRRRTKKHKTGKLPSDAAGVRYGDDAKRTN